ncbi:MAG TPA: DNA translocase FtsK 4TM domain-containing protein [bacterium]|nr:DNA translocase FtsK 4TM domain-containing protein [bacterium]
MGYRRRRSGFWGIFRRRPRSRFDNFSVTSRFSSGFRVSPDTKKGIFIILLFVVAALSLLGVLDLYGDNRFGRIVAAILSWLLGDLQLLLPVVLILFGYFLIREDKYQVKIINYIGGLMFILGLTGMWHLRFSADQSLLAAKEGVGGGHLGVVLSLPLLNFMGWWGALVITLAIFLVGLLLTFETSIYGLMWPIKLFAFLGSRIKLIYLRLRTRVKDKRRRRAEQLAASEDLEEEEEDAEEERFETEEPDEKEEAAKPVFVSQAVSEAADDLVSEPPTMKLKKFGRRIELPLNLLTARSGKPTSGDIKSNQEIIRKTLANFGIATEMSEVNVGPTVTQYTLRPADGVKLSRITNLNSDLALALAAHPIRIEAPIPGRSLVGLEIPNQMAARVTMNELLSGKEFKSRQNNLLIALGKDVSGKPTFAPLDRMPHLLIAGATGSGKSVCINSIIVSLLYQNSPDELKFILVDPKRVELPIYNGIPYLLTPVITDVKKTINALKWTVSEMDRRFDLLSRAGRRNIAAYNQSTSDKLPYIVFVIDELADLMSTAANDVEGGIVRLAQMARAVGIHLILATQRPSVEVITGLIKANVPARIAFSVASLIDSRTILDNSGAEKLVGRGDMLYLGPEVAKPKRIQGVFLSDKEIKNVVDYIKNQGEAEYIEEIVTKPGGPGWSAGGFSEDADPLLGEAQEIIRESGKASASLFQRRLKIGYARAARLLDLLEEQGIVGPADGAKPREVFLDKLGGIGAVEFAAKEHNLTGELAGGGFASLESEAEQARVETEDSVVDQFEAIDDDSAGSVLEIETGVSGESESPVADDWSAESEPSFSEEEISDENLLAEDSEPAVEQLAKKNSKPLPAVKHQPLADKQTKVSFDDGEWS